jgi:hypothetical protein
VTAGGGPPRAAAWAVAAATGASTLAVEFAAVRLLAPWFGQSNLVWAHAVAVVLLGLALGQWVGGILAESPGAVDRARLGLAGAALWLLAAARLGPDLAAWLSPVEVGGDRPLPLSAWGSLAATVALFGPPVLALGIAAPVWIHRVAGSSGASRAAGSVLAAASIGSLLGSYGTPLGLLPGLGARRTLEVAAALAAGAALVSGGAEAAAGAGRARAKGSRRAALFPAAVAALLGLWVTGCEFGAVRALAPAFGQSGLVWANVIGVILLSLALGNALGGRIARDRHRPRLLAAVLAAGALWVGAAAWVGPDLARALAPGAGSAAGETRGVLGGLAAAAALFGVPMVALGTASPALVGRLSVARGAGRAAGAVLLAGTLGSVVGCYAAPLWLLPELGTKATLSLSAAGLLAAAAASAAWRGGSAGARAGTAS